MNKVTLIGRVTKDPSVRYTNGKEPLAIARFTLAVDRKYQKDKEKEVDFIPCVAFGGTGKYAENYVRKGMRIGVAGRIQTGSYEDKDGRKVYTTDVIAEELEILEKIEKREEKQQTVSSDGFMKIPDGVEEELPFA